MEAAFEVKLKDIRAMVENECRVGMNKLKG
jgi:hypothetical protein